MDNPRATAGEKLEYSLEAFEVGTRLHRREFEVYGMAGWSVPSEEMSNTTVKIRCGNMPTVILAGTPIAFAVQKCKGVLCQRSILNNKVSEMLGLTAKWLFTLNAPRGFVVLVRIVTNDSRSRVSRFSRNTPAYESVLSGLKYKVDTQISPRNIVNMPIII